MVLTKQKIAKMLDVSVLKADCSIAEVEQLAAFSIENGCECALTIPSLTPHLIERLKTHPEVQVAGVVGLP